MANIKDREFVAVELGTASADPGGEDQAAVWRYPEPRFQFEFGGGGLRKTVSAIVLAAIGWILLHGWLVQGLVVPMVVSGNSMAPTLHGPRFVAETGGGPPRLVDFAEGSGWRRFTQGKRIVPGDRLLIDRAGFFAHAPSRWQIVVLRHPQKMDELCVKRIVGLPGETLTFHDGDVWIDGRIARKDLAAARKSLTLVHDTTVRDLRNRRRPGWGGWHNRDGKLLHQVELRKQLASDSPLPPWSWTRFFTDRPASGCGPTPRPSGFIRDGVDVVHDIIVRCQASLSGQGAIAFSARDGRHRFVVAVAVPSGLGMVFDNGQLIANFTTAAELSGNRTIEFALIDQQVILAVDEQQQLAYQYNDAPGDRPPVDATLGIGAQAAEVRLDRVQVYRDIYYRDWPRGKKAGRTWKLGADEVFVVGDNVAYSRDSRNWDKPGVPLGLVLGTARRVSTAREPAASRRD